MINKTPGVKKDAPTPTETSSNKKSSLTNNNYKKYYIETILTQSIRSVFQILKFYNNHYTGPL